MRKIYTIILISFFVFLLSSRGFVLPYGGHSSLLFSISHVLADDGGDGGGDGGDGDGDGGDCNCDDGGDDDGDGGEHPSFTIVATKILCESELNLPNWSGSSTNI